MAIIVKLFQAVFGASFVMFMFSKVLLHMFQNITYVLFVDFSVKPCIHFDPAHYP